MKISLTKSSFVKGVRCEKLLWLSECKKEALNTEASKSFLDLGNEVGKTARKLFSEGKEIKFSATNDMVNNTKSLIDKGIKVIYEAGFSFDNIFVAVDIFKMNDDNSIEIYEVKSSTDLKDTYYQDVSIQYYVLDNLGYKIKSANIIYLNKEYVRNGKLDLSKLFIIENVTDEIINLQNDIPDQILRFRAVLSNCQNEPDVEIGKYCNQPYECDVKHYCWRQKNIPKYSIFNIFNLGSEKQKALYSESIVNIDDIPDNFDMTETQKEKVNLYKSKKPYVNEKEINTFLKGLSYPIYHLDFETFSEPIPSFDNQKVFEQIPFQYSIHIEHSNGELEHKEYLAKEGIDPRYDLAVNLIKDIPENVTVLAYHASFEKNVIKRLAELFNSLSNHLNNICENIKDLEIPFKNRYYYVPALNGGSSIKNVLPALVPEMEKAYKELDLIHNGGEAMEHYNKLKFLSNNEEKERIKKALLKYCELDTLAMVKVLEKLRESVK